MPPIEQGTIEAKMRLNREEVVALAALHVFLTENESVRERGMGKSMGGKDQERKGIPTLI